MVLDTLKNMDLYEGLGENFKQVAEYVKKTDLRTLEAGKHDLENGVYFMVQEYTTKDIAAGKYEAHRKYIDIQIILEGEEIMGYAPIETLAAETDYDESGDYQLFTGEGSLLNVVKDNFAIFFPEDGHMPGVGTSPCEVKKIVVKVPVEQ